MGLFFFGIFLSSSFSLFYLSLDKSPISLDFFFDSKSIFISGCFLFCRSRQIWLKSLNFAGDEFELRQMMQAAANLSVIWNLSLRGSSSKVHILSPKYQKSHALHCLRSEGHEEFENSPQENLGLSSVTKEIKHKDIWSLFKEAQQNIMFLNKQRLAAVEELKKLKKEKDELLERINQLEEESQIVIKKAACKPNMEWLHANQIWIGEGTRIYRRCLIVF
ncbi:PREDICTED: uncharacterized protein LOC104754243 [Camelina sativa]|uniref:Uncharacterized protein LOC104754243 n=1 Tax=Camelina sativa TaxID=90675 RepID=A0ABM0WQE1_CAMSA|nr:PREDICTED: uncharacterized protein LOC104754243 [Camelina sativa]